MEQRAAAVTTTTKTPQNVESPDHNRHEGLTRPVHNDDHQVRELQIEDCVCMGVLTFCKVRGAAFAVYRGHFGAIYAE